MASDTSAERKESEQSQGLVQQPHDVSRAGSPDEDIVVHAAQGREEITHGERRKGMVRPPKRQSSFAQPRPNGTPRTPHRVRFEVEEPQARHDEVNGHVEGIRRPDAWLELEEDDYLAEEDGRSRDGQRAPLLTDIEAPSVSVANDLPFNPEELLHSARPRSGLKSAFMNMANSIIGAGIIGQPYAFKQAGLITGIILLISLTVTVDWTVRLIVTNAKLSGTNSFQETMEKCFGKSGLVAISVAQWAFAFGGMVAFCIIIGDTIPHVLGAAFPGLYDTPILFLLTNRRAIIVLMVLGISYPLSLYRDIAMVRLSLMPTNPNCTSS
jgi:solute carrier family 38 (sodium-coupled neutral amino acid transporter), member 11